MNKSNRKYFSRFISDDMTQIVYVSRLNPKVRNNNQQEIEFNF
jgi:hypothetical protein